MPLDRNNWIRTNANNPCPICGNKTGCLISTNGTAACCLRVQAGCAKHIDGSDIQLSRQMGWLHYLKDSQNAVRKGDYPVGIPVKEKSVSPSHWRALQRRFHADINPNALAAFAERMGLSTDNLRIYGTGWDASTRCFSFPMYSGMVRGEENSYDICGFRLRNSSGGKFAVAGSRNGLFMPTHFELVECPFTTGVPLLLVMPEGVTDAVAMADLGFLAIGRPSATGGIDELRSLLAVSKNKQDVIVMADRDPTKWFLDKDRKPVSPYWPGIEGAISTAQAILPYVNTVKIIQPPKGIKDFREWISIEGTDVRNKILNDESTVLNKHRLLKMQKQINDFRPKMKRPDPTT